jgi:hypothetical protein
MDSNENTFEMDDVANITRMLFDSVLITAFAISCDLRKEHVSRLVALLYLVCPFRFYISSSTYIYSCQLSQLQHVGTSA